MGLLKREIHNHYTGLSSKVPQLELILHMDRNISSIEKSRLHSMVHCPIVNEDLMRYNITVNNNHSFL